METRRAVVAWSAGIAAAAGAICTLLALDLKTSPWHDVWFVIFFVLALVAFVILFAAGIPDLTTWLSGLMSRQAGRHHQEVEASSGERLEVPLKDIFTRRWQYFSNGVNAPTAMTAMDIVLPGTEHLGPLGEQRSLVRFVFLAACSPISPDPTGLWPHFRHFLDQPQVEKFVRSLTHCSAGTSWRRYATNRASVINAVLTSDGENDAVASARLELPDGTSYYGRNQNYATLILHVGLRGPDIRSDAPPVEPAIWRHRLNDVLQIPTIFASFLSCELDLVTSGEPPALVGAKLQAMIDLTELIDISGFQQLPGGSLKRQAIGYFVADHDKGLAWEAASKMVGDVLLYALNVDENS